MTANEIATMIRQRADARARAARLLHAELRARLLVTTRRIELARTPLELGTPGSVDRYLDTLCRCGDAASHRAAFANRLREQRDTLLLGRL